MLDIDYLGKVNNPDGLPGLYDQSSPRTRYLAANRPTENVVGNCEIRQYLRSFSEIPDTPVVGVACPASRHGGAARRRA
eukprot:1493591-Pleurochrysis_carterae.AAC.1